MFTLNRGDDRLVKMEPTHARRAQSTVRSFSWKQVGIIDSLDPIEAEKEAVATLREWSLASPSYIKNSRWQLEGIGNNAGFVKELC